MELDMSEPDPLFSIIVPVYNTKAYIRGCINSLRGQSFTDFEVIAVDDGSTDGSLNILREMAREDPRIRVFTKANGGQGAARNYGITKARGKYTAFVDSDDTVSPDLLENAIAAFTQNDIDVFSFGIQFVNSKGKVVISRGPSRIRLSRGEEIFLDALLDKDYYSVVWNKIYRSSLLIDNAIVFPELRAYEDSVFSRHVALHARSVLYSNEPLYLALTRSGSTSRGMSVESFVRAAEMLRVERDLFGHLFSNSIVENTFRAHIAHFLAYLTVLAAFRIDDSAERAACKRIADDAGFRDCADDRQVRAMLDRNAQIQVFLARFPSLLRVAAVCARRLGRVPY